MSELLFSPDSEAEMIAAGEDFATRLDPGDVIALNGQLGAGKTHFSKGIVAGLGSESDVTSPTFALVQEYPGGRLPIFHFDFYRLEDAAELIHLGWDEYLDEDGIIIVEWAEKFPEVLPGGTITLEIRETSNGAREIRKL